MNIPQRFFNSLFIILLALPFGLTICGAVPKDIFLKDIFLTENRTLTEKPKLKKLSLRQWPKKLDPWFQDQLAFRSHLVSLYLYLWEDCLQSPVKDFATGHDGEWFPILDTAPVLQNYLGLHPLTKEHLVQLKLAHAGMYALLKTHRIQYLLVTIPDKTTLYPELLPFWTHWNKGQSHYTQRYNILKNIGIPYIDLLPILTAKKSTYKIYNKKFDTGHWNGYGLEIAYQALGHALAQKDITFTPKPLGTYYNIYQKEHKFNRYTKECIPIMRLLNVQKLELQMLPEIPKDPHGWMTPQLIINNNPLSSLTVWFAADSYFLAAFQDGGEKIWEGDLPVIAYHPKKFLKMHLKNLTQPFLKESFKKNYRPNIVIEAFIERNPTTITHASDPLIRILGDIYLNTPGYILTPDTIQQHLCGTHKNLIYTPKTKDNTTLFTTTEHDPYIYIYLQPITTNADGRAMLAVRMHVPVKTITKLYYAPAGTQAFDDQHAVAIELEQGEHLIHLSFIDEPHKKMDLRFHPGCHPGEYHILPMPDDVQTFQRIHKTAS